ncbi:unnamed protein product [Rotaria sp. Silwood1]|nr:unnamed protein product [Rotaria sp. Silwood1]
MSQSGYDVGNTTNELPEFAQLSVGKGIITNHSSTNQSSCYYIPTIVSRIMRNFGKYILIRGGIRMHPSLTYDHHLRNTFYPWRLYDGLSKYDPTRSVAFLKDALPFFTTNENILFKRVKYGSGERVQYGPSYLGKTTLADYTGWDNLIKQEKATIDDKKIISAMSKNEGKLESIQSYDSEIVSVGAMQKTINSKGTGEFPKQLWEFKNQYPKLYEDLFKAHGWTVKEDSGTYSMSYNEKTGNELKDSIRKDFQKKVKSASSKPLEVLVNAVSSKELQEKQVIDSVNRLHQQVLSIKPTGYESYTLNDYLQSNLGRGLALDQHVNRPGYVKKDFGQALKHLFNKYKNLSKNPAEWGSNREKYEAELVDYYGQNRRMTDAVKRYNELKKDL